MGKGSETRVRILDVAEEAVLEKGFEATSIEEIVAALGITKGGFFYHFRDKNALAMALLERYIAREDELFDEIFDRARDLSDDPLHAMLIGLKLLAETLEDMPSGHPGCLVASASYQERLFDRNVRELNRTAMLRWRARFRKMFEDITEAYEPQEAVDLDDLADMVSGVVEGGIILQKALKDPRAVSKQLMKLRLFVKLLFSPQLSRS